MLRKLLCTLLCLSFVFLSIVGCSSDAIEPPSPTETAPLLTSYDDWLSSTLDEDGLPENNVDTFRIDSPAIYYTVYFVIIVADSCGVIWYYEGEVIQVDDVDKEDGEEYTGLFTASLTRPEDGFKPGKYAVSTCYTAPGGERVFWIVAE
jgi:hypothetical protein